MAAGYNDGSIRLFDPWTGECEVTFTGHKSAVIILAFDSPGLRLVSGSRDTNIVVWDIVAESGLYRLHGHKVEIQCLGTYLPWNFFVRESLSS